MTETSTQQRPWWQVAPWPTLAADHMPEAAIAHYAAMTLAYNKALEPAIINARTPKESDHARATLFLPMSAALTAAASLDQDEEWTINRVRDVLADPGDIAEWCHQWLTAAGINPDEIAPAT